MLSDCHPTPTWYPNLCWAYDEFGNRLSQNTSDQPFTQGSGTCATSGTTSSRDVWAQYNTQNQVIQTNYSGSAVAPYYDNDGNIVSDNVNQYVYDGEGRLCAVNGPGGMVGYLYDSGGNRVAKGTITSMTCDPTANGFLQTAGYVVGPSGEQLTEVDANNQWTHTNVYAGGRLIATYDDGGTPGAQVVHYHIDDPLGTRRAQVFSRVNTRNPAQLRHLAQSKAFVACI